MRSRARTGARLNLAVALALILALCLLPATAQAQGQVHVVQRGETLSAIAARYGTTISAIMQANGLGNANFVWVGQRLIIPGGGAASSGGGSTGGGGGIHVVQRGETLFSIARHYGTTAAALSAANGIGNPNLIYVGQRLRVSGGTSGGGGTSSGGGGGSTGGIHVVQRGETLASIARRYGTTAAALAAANGIGNPNLIYVGQRLRVSGGTSSGGGGTPPPAGGGSRWIDVNLSGQSVTAYEGNTAVRSMTVSTGTASYPTPPGRFKIYSKYPSVNMSGPGYYLPNVPHTMFFYKGYALHGTYWHNNFGRPMSHGCINLTTTDAAWLYSWASVGTEVVIHW